MTIEQNIRILEKSLIDINLIVLDLDLSAVSIRLIGISGEIESLIKILKAKQKRQ